MKLFKKIASITFLFFVWSGLSYAGTCEIQYTRTACPGKEKISYKKCKGKQSCSKFKEAADANECKAMATKSCGNKRLTVTKSKVINALFEGAKLQTDGGSDDFCTVYAKVKEEFNRCDG